MAAGYTLMDNSFRPQSRGEAIAARRQAADPHFSGDYATLPPVRGEGRRLRRRGRIPIDTRRAHGRDVRPDWSVLGDEYGATLSTDDLETAPPGKNRGGGGGGGLPLGRVTLDATPEVLDRIDKLTVQAEAANRTAKLAVVASIGVAVLAMLLLMVKTKQRPGRLVLTMPRKKKLLPAP